MWAGRHFALDRGFGIMQITPRGAPRGLDRLGIDTPQAQVSRSLSKGNPVEVGDGPAAVTGDEICSMPLSRR